MIELNKHTVMGVHYAPDTRMCYLAQSVDSEDCVAGWGLRAFVPKDTDISSRLRRKGYAFLFKSGVVP